MPPWLRAPTVAGGLLVTLATIAITGVQIFLQARYLGANGIVTGVTGLPEWPFVAAATLFILLFALAIFGSLATALAETVRDIDVRSIAVLLAWAVAVGLIVLLALFPQHAPFELPRGARGIFAISLCFILIFLGDYVLPDMSTLIAIMFILAMALIAGTRPELRQIESVEDISKSRAMNHEWG